ncbi:MAG: hypothetical protein WKF96_04520, partial [Solirubrobacteraceae bacterium]
AGRIELSQAPDRTTGVTPSPKGGADPPGDRADQDAAFERVRQERQTKKIIEHVVGRAIEQDEIVNAANGGKAFKIAMT